MLNTKLRIVLFSLFFCILNFSFMMYFHTYEKVIAGGDSWGYYSHLASTFIYHDLGDYRKTVAGTREVFPDHEDNFADYNDVRLFPPGKCIIKYTNGVAIVLSPFFAAAHLYCKITKHYPANGFTTPYAVLLGLGILFWTCLAYYFLTRLLLRYFKPTVVVLTVVAIVLGTNLFYNTAYNYMMSHALLFAFYTFLLYNTDNYYRHPSLKSLILMALCVGFIVLIRPNELYCILIPLLYNITSFKSIKDRVLHFIERRLHVVIASACALVIFIPQIIYWKTLTGSFIYNGYIGESFDFKNPHIYEGLLSFRNGWLVWSPIMVLSLLGIFFLRKYARHVMLPLMLILPIHIYIIYSWWCYVYINGFGSRPMEHLYPILSFAMASCIAFLVKNKLTKIVATVVVILAIALNLFQTWQDKKGMIITAAMTKGYYMAMFGKTNISKKAIVAYASEEVQYDDLKPIKSLFKDQFNDSSNANNLYLPRYNRTMRHLSNMTDTIGIFSLEEQTSANYLDIKFINLFPSSNSYRNQWDCPLVTFRHLDKHGNKLQESSIRQHIVTGNPTNTIWTNGTPDTCDNINFNFKIINPSHTKQVVICTWNPTKQPFYIDDLEVVAAE